MICTHYTTTLATIGTTIAAAGLLTVLTPSTARAGELEACGGVFFFGNIECRFVPKTECDTVCEPVAMETTCASRLFTSCDGSCTATAEAGCKETCQTECDPACTTQAETDPPNSMGLCMSSCQQDCNDACGGAENGECRSSCAHNCAAKCKRANCSEDDDEVECVPKCATSCEGSCWASASSECQISCQSEQFTVCKTEEVEKCHEDCDTKGGAIFCNGQFLDAVDLKACADELLVEFDVDIDVEVDVDGEVDADVDDDGDDDIDFNCNVPGGTSGHPGIGGLAGLLLAAGGLGLSRRRRRMQ